MRYDKTRLQSAKNEAIRRRKIRSLKHGALTVSKSGRAKHNTPTLADTLVTH